MTSQDQAIPAATVIVSTKNRKDDLRRALASCALQTAILEVIVLDDGSSDGSAEMVAAEHPEVVLIRDHVSRGYIVRRNQGAERARSNYLVSIDDDAAFSAPDTVEKALECFDHPRVGAVTVPYVDVLQGPTVKQPPSGDAAEFVTGSFVGTAHLLRRDVFLSLGGYREELLHQGEEADYSLRMLDAGFVVRVGSAPPVHHFESPRRDNRRIDLLGRRNDVLFGWQNVPHPFVVPHLIATTFNGIAFGAKHGKALRMAGGLLDGLLAVLSGRAARRPVSIRAYRLQRELKKKGPRPLAAVEARLPPMRSLGHANASRR